MSIMRSGWIMSRLSVDEDRGYQTAGYRYNGAYVLNQNNFKNIAAWLVVAVWRWQKEECVERVRANQIAKRSSIAAAESVPQRYTVFYNGSFET